MFLTAVVDLFRIILEALVCAIVTMYLHFFDFILPGKQLQTLFTDNNSQARDKIHSQAESRRRGRRKIKKNK